MRFEFKDRDSDIAAFRRYKEETYAQARRELGKDPGVTDDEVINRAVELTVEDMAKGIVFIFPEKRTSPSQAAALDRYAQAVRTRMLAREEDK